jgi:hypothetical protein
VKSLFHTRMKLLIITAILAIAVMIYSCATVPPLYYSPDGKILIKEVNNGRAAAKKLKTFFTLNDELIEKFGLYYKDSKLFVYGTLRYDEDYLEEFDLFRINVEINLRTKNLLYVTFPVENLPLLEDVPGIDFFDIDKKGKIRLQQAAELNIPTTPEPEPEVVLEPEAETESDSVSTPEVIPETETISDTLETVIEPEIEAVPDSITVSKPPEIEKEPEPD